MLPTSIINSQNPLIAEWVYGVLPKKINNYQGTDQNKYPYKMQEIKRIV
jgi:hypothetical protein